MRAHGTGASRGRSLPSCVGAPGRRPAHFCLVLCSLKKKKLSFRSSAKEPLEAPCQALSLRLRSSPFLMEGVLGKPGPGAARLGGEGALASLALLGLDLTLGFGLEGGREGAVRRGQPRGRKPREAFR